MYKMLQNIKREQKRIPHCMYYMKFKAQNLVQLTQYGVKFYSTLYSFTLYKRGNLNLMKTRKHTFEQRLHRQQYRCTDWISSQNFHQLVCSGHSPYWRLLRVPLQHFAERQPLQRGEKYRKQTCVPFKIWFEAHFAFHWQNSYNNDNNIMQDCFIISKSYFGIPTIVMTTIPVQEQFWSQKWFSCFQWAIMFTQQTWMLEIKHWYSDI